MVPRKNATGLIGIFKTSAMALVLCLIYAMMMGANDTQVPAASAPASRVPGYFPDQFVNQATAIEPLPDTYDYFGLPATFPEKEVDPAAIFDSTPAMYS